METVIDAGRPRLDHKSPIEVAQHVLEHVDPLVTLLATPESERSASFRVLRHRVCHEDNPQVILVSSALPGEGKTLCAANLALALGEAGRARVLLLEANLRAPTVANLFRFTPPWCFADQLTAHRSMPMQPWKVVELEPSGLHVAAISAQPQMRRLIDAPSFAIAMERFRPEYDHIVIDGPPVVGTAEVNLLQESADAIILAAKVGRSSARLLKSTQQQLAPSHILGVVLVEGNTDKS